MELPTEPHLLLQAQLLYIRLQEQMEIIALTQLKVTLNVTSQIDWANLQYPSTTTFSCDGGFVGIYGRVYEPGITNFFGQGAGLTVEYGYNTPPIQILQHGQIGLQLYITQIRMEQVTMNITV